MGNVQLDDEALERYSRQLLMPAFDVKGQQRLLQSSVLVVGAGGLGCPVVLYLAAAGLGRLRVFDPDRVELANLQRQIAFSMADLGRPKAEVLCERASAINPHVTLQPRIEMLDPDSLRIEVKCVDLVIDASDNFATRFAVNNACVEAGVPLLSGAAIRAEGQVALFHPASQAGGCYQCLYSNTDEPELGCSDAGVMGPLVGMIGTVQAMEAIKWLSGVGRGLAGRLLVLDAWQMQWRELRLVADQDCPVCGGVPA
ncbi:MAG: molybdopterin-synthase adenylyltransferase MoeB [Alteromonadaceae bacterium]|nr:molybdopterin-synthase adenylyltransferase MoeB [Alteromonadaceae bacterium]